MQQSIVASPTHGTSVDMDKDMDMDLVS